MKRPGRSKISGIRKTSRLRSERGTALVIVLVLSAVALAIVSTLIYVIISGTRVSGMQKRYKTAVEAASGAADLVYQLVALRGHSTDQQQFIDKLNDFEMNAAVTVTTACTGTNIDGTSFSGLAAKLNSKSTVWSASCGTSLTIDPSDASTYDVKMDMGKASGPMYTAYGKIVYAVEGNTGGDSGLLTKGVVSSGGGDVPVSPQPYLYAIEVQAENSANRAERAKFNVLYQY